MWTLLFIVLVPVVGIDRVTLLESYHSKEHCEAERERIMIEMAKTYPDDPTWTLACRFSSKGV